MYLRNTEESNGRHKASHEGEGNGEDGHVAVGKQVLAGRGLLSARKPIVEAYKRNGVDPIQLECVGIPRDGNSKFPESPGKSR